MKSIINRESLHETLEDRTIDTSKYVECWSKFKKCKKEYHDAKVAYNTFKKYKLMRMNENTMKVLKSMYNKLSIARQKYYEAKKQLNATVVYTFTKKITLKLTKREIGALGARLIELYRAQSERVKDTDLIEFTIHTSKSGRVL